MAIAKKQLETYNNLQGTLITVTIAISASSVSLAITTVDLSGNSLVDLSRNQPTPATPLPLSTLMEETGDRS